EGLDLALDAFQLRLDAEQECPPTGPAQLLILGTVALRNGQVEPDAPVGSLKHDDRAAFLCEIGEALGPILGKGALNLGSGLVGSDLGAGCEGHSVTFTPIMLRASSISGTVTLSVE